MLLFLAVFPSLVAGAALGKRRYEQPLQRTVLVKNQSGRRFDVFWINNVNPGVPESFVTQSEGAEGYPYGGETSILSFIGHAFEIREMPSKKTHECLYGMCRRGRFKVNDQENQGEPVKTCPYSTQSLCEDLKQTNKQTKIMLLTLFQNNFQRSW